MGFADDLKLRDESIGDPGDTSQNNTIGTESQRIVFATRSVSDARDA